MWIRCEGSGEQRIISVMACVEMNVGSEVMRLDRDYRGYKIRVIE